MLKNGKIIYIIRIISEIHELAAILQNKST